MGAPRIAIHPAEAGDAERLSLEIYNAVWPHDAVTLAESRAFKASARERADYLATLDGEPAGSAVLAVMPPRPRVPYFVLTVLEAHRRHGVGAALYGRLSDWARERGFDTLETKIVEDDAGSLSYAERRGFREHSRDGKLVLELAGVDPPPVAAPPGVEMVTLADRADLASGMYEVALEALPDVPGDEDVVVEPFTDWVEHQLRGPGDRPDASFVALAGDEVVAYAKLSLTEARPNVASHDMTAVKRAWRSRGIAGALKRAEIAWAKRAGYERLETTNEMRNEPIRRLNERLGYRPAPGWIFVRGPLAGSPSPSRARTPSSPLST